jgi:hypothetical protein
MEDIVFMEGNTKFDLKEPCWKELSLLMIGSSDRCCEHSSALSGFINAGNALGSRTNIFLLIRLLIYQVTLLRFFVMRCVSSNLVKGKVYVNFTLEHATRPRAEVEV